MHGLDVVPDEAGHAVEDGGKLTVTENCTQSYSAKATIKGGSDKGARTKTMSAHP